MMIKSIFFLIFVFFIITQRTVVGTNNDDDNNCKIDVYEELQYSEPLIITTESLPKFVYPDINTPKTIEVKHDNWITLVCGVFFYFVHCYEGGLQYENLDFDMSKTKCTYENSGHMIKPVKNVSCPQNVICLYIGFQVNAFEFIPTIDMIMINPARKRPLWAHTTLLSIIEYRQLRGEAKNYKKDVLFEDMAVDIEDLYKKDYQKRRLLRLLKSEDIVKKYIKDKEYLVKGQLIDHDDLFYKPQQDTVHYYANVMPMWSRVVNGNWKLAGNVARRIAKDLRANLDLWSGAMETLKLKDSSGVEKEIYLATDNNGQGIVPVPKILFKYVYEPKSNRGLVILTINNPFLTILPNEYKLCNELPICANLHPDFKNFENGYTYCCSLQDFAPIANRRGMPSFPQAKSIYN